MEHLTKETFKSKVCDYEKEKAWKFNGDLPCIIDFYAEWCGPCKMVSPVLDAVAEEYKGKINVYKIDTDKEEELSSAFGINSVPTILFVPKNGQPQVAMGALPKQAIVQAINDVLLKEGV